MITSTTFFVYDLVESKVLQDFRKMRLNTVALGVFSEILNVTNHRELWDAELS